MPWLQSQWHTDVGRSSGLGGVKRKHGHEDSFCLRIKVREAEVFASTCMRKT